jgi:hypothetical protein
MINKHHVVDGGLVDFTDTGLQPDLIVDPVVADNADNNVLLSGQYEITDRFDTYAKGVDFIRNVPIDKNRPQPILVKTDGSKIYRQLTTLESLEVIVNDYNRLQNVDGRNRSPEDRERLFNNYKFTCTGVAYEKGGKSIKIIPESSTLITIPETHNTGFLDIDYSNMQETKLGTGKSKYDVGLLKSEVLNHPAWIASVEDIVRGRDVLKEYADIVFSLLKAKNKSTGMGFYLFNKPDADQLRALFVNFGSGSVANGSGNLSGSARFLFATPLQKNLGVK